MKGAHTYFLLTNWINWLAPSGYWAMWVFMVLKPMDTLKPVLDDALALVTETTDIVALISTDDVDGDGDVDADDATAL
jgi:hypothetical protein